jgi:hypothetical protein
VPFSLALAIPPIGLDKKDQPCFKWVEFFLRLLNTASRGKKGVKISGFVRGAGQGEFWLNFQRQEGP